METYGLDVGGSGIKGAPVDLERGELTGERVRIKTPQPATPEAIVETAVAVISESGWDGPVGCGFPAVMKNGIAHTAANIDDRAIGFDFGGALQRELGNPVHIVNDADAAGLAEMRWGAGRDITGVVLMLTVGTGIGTALFLDGKLVPNTELGHIVLPGRHDGDAEDYAADSARKREDLEWEAYAGRLNEYLTTVEQLVWPDLIIIGGGLSKKAEKYFSRLEARTELTIAELQNEAGIIGAALAGVTERADDQAPR